jgi:CheY-like chemotaxis protein
MNAAVNPEPLPKILVADPDPECRLLYGEVLGLTESEIAHAVDGRDALVKALAQPYTLLITETHLPFIDGYGLCEVLRHDPATHHLPIMVVTADARPASLTRALAAGADVALAKPIDPAGLAADAQRLLLHCQQLRERSDRARLKVATLLQKSNALLQRSARARKNSHSFQRYDTRQPPIEPPPLRCPSCDRFLEYAFSHIGGVTAADPEQWDYFTCPDVCGKFQYRHRTRKLRPV